jgi:hypothetical protein
MLLVAVLRPDDVEVDRLLTLLFVVLKPVDREFATPLSCAMLGASVSALPALTPVICRSPMFSSPDELCLPVSPKAS